MSGATPEPRMAYVARLPDCGCVVGASVDEPAHAKDTAKFVAAEVRAGRVIERVTVEQARSMQWGWPCPHAAAPDPDPTLFDSVPA